MSGHAERPNLLELGDALSSAMQEIEALTAKAKCRKCGGVIRSGSYCTDCASRLAADPYLREHQRASILVEVEDR